MENINNITVQNIIIVLIPIDYLVTDFHNSGTSCSSQSPRPALAVPGIYMTGMLQAEDPCNLGTPSCLALFSCSGSTVRFNEVPY